MCIKRDWVQNRYILYYILHFLQAFHTLLSKWLLYKILSWISWLYFWLYYNHSKNFCFLYFCLHKNIVPVEILRLNEVFYTCFNEYRDLCIFFCLLFCNTLAISSFNLISLLNLILVIIKTRIIFAQQVRCFHSVVKFAQVC